MNYVAYDLTTGRIFSTGCCPDDQFSTVAPPAHAIMATDVIYAWDRFKVVDGAVVPMTEAELAELAAKLAL